MNNPRQQLALQEKQETTEQMIFRQFQEKFKELAEYTLSKPDEEIHLNSYRIEVHETVESTMEFIDHEGNLRKGTIKGITCKSAFCICGNMVELWPKKYKWTDCLTWPEPIRIGDSSVPGANLIYDIIIPGGYEALNEMYPWLPELFETNMTHRTDRKEIQNRIRIVMESNSLKELNATLTEC